MVKIICHLEKQKRICQQMSYELRGSFMLEILKGQVALANRILAEERMNAFGVSSISAVDRNSNAIVIRPDGIGIKKLSSENMLVISLEDGRVIEGHCKRPEDTSLHLSIYKNFLHIDSVAHVYPYWLSIYAQAGKEIPIFGRKHASRYKSKLSCTRMLTEEEAKESGAVSASVIEELQNCEPLEYGGVLVRYDGVITWSTTPLKALDGAKFLEGIAKAAWHIEAICRESCRGMPVSLAEQYYVATISAKTASEVYGIPGNQITFLEERQVCLNLLIYFDKVCRANNINYSLTGGTLLGAVRHQGFIPWDDDVDVFLTRPEFNKLEEAFQDDSRYVFVTRKKDRNFNYVFGRLIDTKTIIVDSPNTVSAGKGLFLDICVVDGLPNNRLLRNLHIAYMRFLVRGRRAVIQNPLGKTYSQKGPIIVFLKKLLRRFTSIEFWNNRLERAMDRYPYESSNYVGNFTSQYGKRELLQKSVFGSYVDMEFENYSFMVCTGYHEYLRNIYGINYMTLPQQKKRRGHHPNTAYWIE